MNNFDFLNEDENDLFKGSAKSKFFDTINNANGHIVEQELDNIVERLALLELYLSQNKENEFDIYDFLNSYKIENFEKIKTVKKDLYIELTGEIISKLDS